MVDTDRVYTIPLRAAKRVPRWRRSSRAMKEIRSYLAKNMKAPLESVKIDEGISELIWARGDEKPPQRVRVRAIKSEDGGVEAELAGDQ
jgi:large subunit ribosomal protein L31e